MSPLAHHSARWHVYVQGSRWAQGEAPGPTLAAQVQMVEYAGDQRFLELQVPGTRLLARVEPEFAVERGQPVAIWFAPGRLRLFDPASELALDAQVLEVPGP